MLRMKKNSLALACLFCAGCALSAGPSANPDVLQTSLDARPPTLKESKDGGSEPQKAAFGRTWQPAIRPVLNRKIDRVEARAVTSTRGSSVPFDIVVHEADSIIEVIYPETPTAADVEDYVRRIKEAIARRRGPWSCLVDQRRLHVLSDTLYERIAGLNAYAQERGMKQSARVVASAVATLQATRMRRQAALTSPVKSFTSRDDAIAWLRR
jgi:hypothetical protein